MTQEVLIAVQRRIMELYPAPIKYVAEDWGQLDYYSDRPPVQFPCVLLDMEEADFSDLSRKVQRIDAVLTVRIADVATSNLSALAPKSEHQFDLLGLTQRIYAHLQGFSGATFSGLTRIKLRRERREDGIKEYVLQFRFGGTDDAAHKPLTMAEGTHVRITPIEIVRP